MFHTRNGHIATYIGAITKQKISRRVKYKNGKSVVHNFVSIHLSKKNSGAILDREPDNIQDSRRVLHQ